MKYGFMATMIAATALLATPAVARDQIRIVGSSTVFPFSSAVAETFGRQGKFKTPVVESTGTGGGMRLFCNGVGVDHPDVTNASRRITKTEFENCTKNGVTNIIEVKIGFDGIVVADSVRSSSFDLSRKDIWLALAKQVPVDGKLAPNPYKTWNQVNPKLPARKIEVLGPPPTSGTRDSFVELVMDFGCRDFAEIKALPDARARSQACGAIREDGAFIEAGENDNLIVQKLATTPEAMGIFGFSFYDQNRDKVKAHTIEGVKDEIEQISSGRYPIARDMYFYVKGQHIGVIPGLKEFVAEYVSEKAFGKDGYLGDKGLIPLPDAERKKVRDSALAAAPLTM
jgi:phosphate transport system substrate-binding protein